MTASRKWASVIVTYHPLLDNPAIAYRRRYGEKIDVEGASKPREFYRKVIQLGKWTMRVLQSVRLCGLVVVEVQYLACFHFNKLAPMLLLEERVILSYPLNTYPTCIH